MLGTFVKPENFYQLISEDFFSPIYDNARITGFNSNIGITEVLISDIGGAAPLMPLSPSKVEVVSNSANDSSAGTGVRKVTISGVDQNFNFIEEEITTSGLTPAVSTNEFWYVNRAFGTESGTFGGSNNGIVTVRRIGATGNFLLIPVGQGQAKHCCFAVPAGYTMFVYDIHMHIEETKSIAISMYAVRDVDDVTVPYRGVKRSTNIYPFTTSQIEYDYSNSPIIFPEKTLVWMAATSKSGTGSAMAEFVYLLRKNP